MTKSKLVRALKNSYVQTAIFGIMVLGGVFALWFGLRIAYGTEYPLLAVATPSMVPTLNIGDLIVVQGVTDPSQINAAPRPNGTIVVFHKPNDPSELIVHRAINKVENDGTWYFQTKGDNNPGADRWTGPETNQQGWISQRLLVGKVVGVVPWIGNVPLFLRTPTGMFLIVVLFIVVILGEFIPLLLKKGWF